MSDDELKAAFQRASTPEEKAVLRQQIIQRIVTDFDVAVRTLNFQQLSQVVNRVRHAHETTRQMSRQTLSAMSDGELVTLYGTAMSRLPSVEASTFKAAYRKAITQKRGAKSEILRRIIDDEMPFVAMVDPDIQSKIADVEFTRRERANSRCRNATCGTHSQPRCQCALEALSDHDLACAYKVAATKSELGAIDDLMAQRLAESYEFSKFGFNDTAYQQSKFECAMTDIRSIENEEPRTWMTFPEALSLDAAIALLPAGTWRVCRGYHHFNPDYGINSAQHWLAAPQHAVREMSKWFSRLGNQKRTITVQPFSNTDLAVTILNAMMDLPQFEEAPDSGTTTLIGPFADAYRLAIFRKRAAKSEILNRISAGVTAPFAGIQDPDIVQQIAAAELAKGLVKGLDAVPVARVRNRVVESI